MGIVKSDMSMSLDGFVAGPPENEELLGKGFFRVVNWLDEVLSWRESHGLEGGVINANDEIARDVSDNTGAYVMGRTMFDFGEEPWGEDPPFHAPVFVVTSRPRDPLVRQGGTTFTFVTDGFESAVGQARAAAGERDVHVSGGASAVWQAIATGLLDELQVHVAPVLLGSGVRLFDQLGTEHIELESTRVVGTPNVIHLRFRVLRPERATA